MFLKDTFLKVFIALETFWYIVKYKWRIWRLWFKKSNYKSEKTILEFNQKNNDLIYQITTSVVKDIPKKIRTLAYCFKARKSLLRFDSIFSRIFFRFYCIIILIVILIRIKEFSCLEYFSIYLDALNLRLFISRKIVLLKNFT